jgi:O-antigen/teichoic acid export membrane protein
VNEKTGNPAEHQKGRSLFWNSLLNFLGQVLPLGIAAVAVPIIIRDMGLERYGLLSLSWILLGYFTFLDMGLSRAATNAVADLDANGKREEVGVVLGVSVTLSLIVGLLAAAIGWMITPWVVDRAFSVPSELRSESIAMFSILAASVPLITVAGTLRGVLEGFHRFDLSNAVRSPSLALMFLLPLLYKPFHIGLAGVVGLIVVSRFCAVILFGWLVWKVDRRAFSFKKRFSGSMRSLLQYAGWATVSNIFSPVVNFAERILLAALLPLGMIGFYTAPYEIISRLPMIPASVGMTLFPSYSSVSKTPGNVALDRLFVRPTKFIMFVVTPLSAVFIFFPKEILSLWLGPVFAEKSAEVLVLLAVGFFFNCLAHVPLAAMLGLGRPDVRAKIDMAEAIIFSGASYAMIVLAGIAGAAIVKASVLALDVLVMFYLMKRIMDVRMRALIPHDLMYFTVTSLCFLAVGIALDLTTGLFLVRLITFCTLSAVYLLLFLKQFTTAEEKTIMLSFGRLLNRS